MDRALEIKKLVSYRSIWKRYYTNLKLTWNKQIFEYIKTINVIITNWRFIKWLKLFESNLGKKY